jgi:hypothetical protein
MARASKTQRLLAAGEGFSTVGNEAQEKAALPRTDTPANAPEPPAQNSTDGLKPPPPPPGLDAFPPPPKVPAEMTTSNIWRQKIADLFPGVLFIALGLSILIWARRDLEHVHTVFSFVQIVLGTAVFLFGTGTTGTGSADIGTYRLYVAGGAGVLAFAIGAGMAMKSQEMKDVFRQQAGFARASFAVTLGGVKSTNLESVTARLNGEALPIYMNGGRVFVLVPVSLKDQINGRAVQIDFEVLPDRKSSPEFVLPVPVTCKLDFNKATLPNNVAEGVQDFSIAIPPNKDEQQPNPCIDTESSSLVINLAKPATALVATTFDPRNTSFVEAPAVRLEAN